MNEFVEQFLIECRELVDQAIDDLLALEERPTDRERLDGAFRAFHTLKGSAGIVDFAAMERSLHAGEDVLSGIRAGHGPVTPALISDCLTCLDQVTQWLDAMQDAGEIPPSAEVQAEAIVRRFSGSTPGVAASEASRDWVAPLMASRPDVAPSATVAVRYRPDPDAFFQGRDPLALLAGLPGLLALDIQPRGLRPSLEDLDPYSCQLTFTALVAADRAAVAGNLAAPGGEVEIHSLQTPVAEPGARERALRLLAEQLSLAAETPAEGWAGRIGAAGRVAAATLRHLGRAGEAAAVAEATAATLRGGGPLLASALRGVLAHDPPGGAADNVVVERAEAEPAARALRVDVERVDALVNLTGELMVARNALGHASALAQTGSDGKTLAALLKSQHAQLGRLVEDLQHAVLNIRVLPLRHVFQRFPRLVREMVLALGKPARLVTEGDRVEADKAVVESLFEPLLHVMRNALDHGVETGPERAAAGKPPSATLWLRASRQGDHVVVELEDDGGGVDLARVREVAAARGVATPEALGEMDDAAIVDLIFAPGFSTAATVSSLSGRGVGMDAVRVAIERLGGRVGVESRSGQGTIVRLTLPFTVMMTRVLTVEANGQLFGVPLEAVVETARVPRDKISCVGAAKAFVLRDRTLVLIDLAETLGAARPAGQNGDAHVLVATAGGQLAGLEVDRLGERMNVMLKPLEGLLSGVPGIAGTTMLGDGRVLLVLDLPELLQ
jgi:two-component system chemotaxis sensor kinase CheA